MAFDSGHAQICVTLYESRARIVRLHETNRSVALKQYCFQFSGEAYLEVFVLRVIDILPTMRRFLFTCISFSIVAVVLSDNLSAALRD